MGIFKNVREDVEEMFNESVGDLTTLIYLYESLGIEIPKNGGGWRGLHFDTKLSEEDDEYLILVAHIYGKDMDICKNCEREGALKRVLGRRCFQCPKCGFQMYPTSNTMFSKSRIPLRTWFRIIKSIAVDNVRIKDIERSCEICYESAHRLFHLVKKSDIYNKIRLYKHTLAYQVVELDTQHEIEKLKSFGRTRWEIGQSKIKSLINKYSK